MPNALSHEDLGAITSASGLTIPAGAASAVITVATQAVRFTLDGSTTPTATVGLQVPVGARVFLHDLNELDAFSVIEETATADVHAEYFGQVLPVSIPLIVT